MFVQTGNHCGAARTPCKGPLTAHILAAPCLIACMLAAPCPCRPRLCCTTHQALASSSGAHAKNTVRPTRWPHVGQPPLCRLALNSMTDTEGPPRTILPFSWYRAPAPAAAYCICRYFCSKIETAYCRGRFYARRRYRYRSAWSMVEVKYEIEVCEGGGAPCISFARKARS